MVVIIAFDVTRFLNPPYRTASAYQSNRDPGQRATLLAEKKGVQTQMLQMQRKAEIDKIENEQVCVIFGSCQAAGSLVG